MKKVERHLEFYAGRLTLKNNRIHFANLGLFSPGVARTPRQTLGLLFDERTV
jgi:hypothetical protein